MTAYMIGFYQNVSPYGKFLPRKYWYAVKLDNGIPVWVHEITTLGLDGIE